MNLGYHGKLKKEQKLMADQRTPWIGTSQYKKQDRRGLPDEEIKNETPKISLDVARQICKNCGHYYFLHISNFKGECDACDSSEYKLEDKCIGFKE